jgi:signal transduction histidine kinase
MNSSQPRHILIADDEEGLLNSMQFLFHRKGYRVTKAKTGIEALQAIGVSRTEGPAIDLLITDIQMPAMDGENLIACIRKIDGVLPIIVMTGFGNKELLVRLMHLGCNDYIDKPFTMQQMEMLVASVLSRASAGREREQSAGNTHDEATIRAIGHDLNNMIQVTLSQAEMAMSELDDIHPAKKKLTRLLASTNAAIDLTQTLFHFKEEASSVKTSLMDLRTFIEETAAAIRSYSPENITICTGASDRPIRLRLNVGQMRQALLNLAKNAVDAMVSGGEVSFTTSVEERHRGARQERAVYACITVTDTGPGFTTAQLKKAFKEGFTTKEHGHGYGLLLVQSVVLEHKGWIEVKNGETCGAEFKLLFPMDDH